jgi:hypothetical protein
MPKAKKSELPVTQPAPKAAAKPTAKGRAAEAAPGSVHVFGIRHHGPGSARSLRQALEALKPDCVLIEGPPDADGLVPLAVAKGMKPPVAILCYDPDKPRNAVYYPFAVFSPEWQAIDYGVRKKIPVRFMDLPQSHRLGAEPPPPPSAPAVDDTDADEAASSDPQPPTPDPQPPSADLRRDPLRHLAEAAGYSDGERWWEHMVEHRRDGADLFAGILEAMTALRDAADAEKVTRPDDREERCREAWMRKTIRAAQTEGFGRIAVVCGAWHAPVLARFPCDEAADAETLKDLKTVNVAATWIPWTHGRLASSSGYGAGVDSPGWYHHLWTCDDRPAIRWLTRVARLLREEDLDVSAAHVIESVRLAETLAALRERPLPGLPEFNEAVQAVYCFGGDTPMRLIHDRLIVGETLGEVPDETPMVPLAADLAREIKRLRLKQAASVETLELDLRKPGDLDKSRLLHRLRLLGIDWGDITAARGKGTFKEAWSLSWKPEYAVDLIEAGVFGNTIPDAASAKVRQAARESGELAALTKLVDDSLLADLPEAVDFLMRRLEAEAAVAADLLGMMAALPPLANVTRYGNVRKTDAAVVGSVVDGLVARICIGLPGACSSMDDDAAAKMYEALVSVNAAVGLLQNAEHKAAWTAALTALADRRGLHGLVAGRSVRLLLEGGSLTTQQAGDRMSLALSVAVPPADSAAWLEGFLKGSGLVLLHDDDLWGIIDSWLAGLSPDAFTQSVPLLRRTFSTFEAPERRQMGEKAKRGPGRPASAPGRTGATATDDFDPVAAGKALPLVAKLLGVG